jgi:hypothetical protein
MRGVKDEKQYMGGEECLERGCDGIYRELGGAAWDVECDKCKQRVLRMMPVKQVEKMRENTKKN